MTVRPTAAKGKFPYPHRSCAEWMARDANRWQFCEQCHVHKDTRGGIACRYNICGLRLISRLEAA